MGRQTLFYRTLRPGVQKLDETKQILHSCKKEYQKLFYEHEALKKNIQWMGTKIKNAENDTEIKKKKILHCQSEQQLWICQRKQCINWQ